MMTSWGEMLLAEIRDTEGPVDVVACTLSALCLAKRFDSGYGGSNGAHFTAWTEARVYFPVVYDGREWVGSAPRNPCDEATAHQGGE